MSTYRIEMLRDRVWERINESSDVDSAFRFAREYRDEHHTMTRVLCGEVVLKFFEYNHQDDREKVKDLKVVMDYYASVWHGECAECGRIGDERYMYEDKPLCDECFVGKLGIERSDSYGRCVHCGDSLHNSAVFTDMYGAEFCSEECAVAHRSQGLLVFCEEE